MYNTKFILNTMPFHAPNKYFKDQDKNGLNHFNK